MQDYPAYGLISFCILICNGLICRLCRRGASVLLVRYYDACNTYGVVVCC